MFLCLAFGNSVIEFPRGMNFQNRFSFVSGLALTGMGIVRPSGTDIDLNSQFEFEFSILDFDLGSDIAFSEGSELSLCR